MTIALSDRPLRFAIPSRNARGRFVRLDAALNDILSAHDYPSAVRHVLAEAVTLAALLGSLLKDAGGQLTLQAQTAAGVIDLLVADYRDGELRGHARFDRERLAMLGGNPSLMALFGVPATGGYLAITFDREAPHGRYQGIVPLEGDTLAEACQSYFFQSEQIPTLIKIATETRDGRCRSAGFLVQHLPDGEEGRERLHVRLDHPEWEHVEILARTLTHAELLDPELSGEALLWRLFHEEEAVRTEDGAILRKGCRCDEAHIRSVLDRFPPEDRAEMADNDGNIFVDCEFCSKQFRISA